MGEENGVGKGGNKGRVGVISLGCPKNLVDTETMLAQLVAAGYSVTHDPEEADLLVVNTCGFVDDAKRESIQAIQEMGEIKAAHPGKRLLVTGCLSQRYGAELAREMPEIDLMVGTDQYHQLIPILESPGPVNRVASERTLPDPDAERILATQPHTAYVKIAEGCDNPCAFCIIPAIRGPYRSRPPAEIEREVARLARAGVREFNLISQDTTLYGRDLTPRHSLAQLVARLARAPGVAWLRLLYLYPTLITDELLTVMAAHPTVTPYLDVPLQHFDDGILQAMKRAERGERIERLIQRIRERLPHASLRTTFIVGFPGETEAAFQRLYDFVERTRFDHLGVFVYSDEEGTAACGYPDKVPPEVAEARQERLMDLQQRISREKLAALVGQTMTVLVDGPSEESDLILAGRTAGQAPEVDGVVLLSDPGDAQPGDFVTVRITEAHDYDLVGEVVDHNGHS